MADDSGAGARSAYLQGVDALIEGRFQDAVGELTAAAQEGLPEAELALAKAHLGLDDGAEAYRWLGRLLATPPADRSLEAYLRLLGARALALQARPDEALRLLEAVPGLDPHMETAARELRRRLERGRPPNPRF